MLLGFGIHPIKEQVWFGLKCFGAFREGALKVQGRVCFRVRHPKPPTKVVVARGNPL